MILIHSVSFGGTGLDLQGQTVCGLRNCGFLVMGGEVERVAQKTHARAVKSNHALYSLISLTGYAMISSRHHGNLFATCTVLRCLAFGPYKKNLKR